MTRMIAVRLLALSGTLCLLALGCEDRTPEPESPQVSSGGEAARHSLEAAEIYIAAGNIDKARAILSRLIKKSPRDARAYEIMARLEIDRALDLRELGLVDASRDQFGVSYGWYQKALERMPESGGLHQSAGEVAQQAGLNDEALALYLQAIELDQENIRSQLSAAQLLLQDDPARSEALLRSVLETDADQPHALSSLALVLQRQGRETGALETASQALAVAGEKSGVRIAVARVHREAGRPRIALELLLALPDNVRAQESATAEIAKSWEAVDRPINAGQAWADCFRGNAHRTDAWRYALNAADAMGRAGQTAVAASWLEQAVMLDAPTNRVDEVRSRIAGNN
ncbi:MAG: tetratricopeptide repeat protein [Planctomycetota bacterium]|nr:tetratricopeptide repeat protein [Planctomycetota bacterium]